MSSAKSKSPAHFPPLIVPPLQEHKTTLLILHGRGSTAQKFAEPLLQQAVSHASTSFLSSTNLATEPLKSFRDHFPNTKFVFPTAPLRRAIVFKRSLTHQWFDNWSLTQPELKQHLQIQGLRETSAFLHDVLRKEIEEVGPGNVVLMGLSQGCAASIVAALLWRGEAFGALVGMCGYLPFRKGMNDVVEEAESEHDDLFQGSMQEEEDDIFARDVEEPEHRTKFERAVEWLREELQTRVGEMDAAEPQSMQSIPIFMGHGGDDEKVPSAIGKLAAEFLSSLDVNVAWKEYEGLGHWYSQDMLRDVVLFLQNLDGWGSPS
jgi:predicted esterase